MDSEEVLSAIEEDPARVAEAVADELDPAPADIATDLEDVRGTADPTGERRQARLGREADGWTRRRAEEELQAVLADLRRGRQNDIASPPPDKPDPLFAEFAHEWFERVRPELRPNTVLDYEWQLVRHLLPRFGRLPLSAITVQEVDRYRQAKVRDGELNATWINKCLTRLAQILEVAVEYDLIGRNPAKGKNRRLKGSKHRGTFLESATEIEALLAGAAELDAGAVPSRSGGRSWRPWCSAACESTRRCRCAGGM